MKRSPLSGVVAAGLLVAAGCAASTKFNATWSEPGAQPTTFKGKSVAALIMSPDRSVRFPAEVGLARELTGRGINGVPAYTIVPVEVTQDEKQAKKFLDDAGVKGVVSMRVIGQDQQITATQGYWHSTVAPYYGSMWGGYWGYGWGAVYSPGYLRTDTVVFVETLVYDLEQDKLIWAGQSTTTNPKDLKKFLNELVSKAATEIRRAGLIAQ